MPDRISNYRQLRLIINPSRNRSYAAGWSLHAMMVKNGIPHASGLASGNIEGLEWDSSLEEVWAAYAWIVNRNYRSPE